MNRIAFQTRSFQRRAWAFTLIELLIVIAIIALLISILLPALQAARNEGTKTVCLSSLKEIMKGNMMYENDQDGSRLINWYALRFTDDGGNPVSQGTYLYGSAQGMYTNPTGLTPWVFGGYRAPAPDGTFDSSDSSVYPAQYRPLNKYIDPAATCREDIPERGVDIIKVYQCPSDRANKVGLLANGPVPADQAVEDVKPAHAALGSSFTLNTRWLQGYYGPNPEPAFQGIFGWTDSRTRIARATVGGGAARFVQWDEIGMYSATQNAAEKLEWSSAQPQRLGWHRKFSSWSAAFADGHATHGYFDTRQVYGFGGTIWQPDWYRGY